MLLWYYILSALKVLLLTRALSHVKVERILDVEYWVLIDWVLISITWCSLQHWYAIISFGFCASNVYNRICTEPGRPGKSGNTLNTLWIFYDFYPIQGKVRENKLLHRSCIRNKRVANTQLKYPCWYPSWKQLKIEHKLMCKICLVYVPLLMSSGRNLVSQRVINSHL